MKKKVKHLKSLNVKTINKTEMKATDGGMMSMTGVMNKISGLIGFVKDHKSQIEGAIDTIQDFRNLHLKNNSTPSQ